MLRSAYVVLSSALLLGASSHAQPYAAAGGFMRPQQVAGPGIVGSVATASHRGVMQVVFADTDGVWRRPLFDTAAAPERVAPAGSIRGVSATTAGDDIAVAWLERDLRTGRTRHSLSWRSRTTLLFETNQEVPMLVGEAGGSPWVLVAPRADGLANLLLYRLSADGELVEPVTLHSTPLNVTGIRAAGTDAAQRGPAYVAWLEGRTEAGGFGSESEWHSYVMSTAPEAAPVRLGLADVADVRQAVAIDRGPDGLVTAAWLTVDGALELTTLRQRDGLLAVEDRRPVGEQGRPIGFAADDVYWIADAFIRRGTVDAAGRLSDVTSVLWSPVPVAGADLHQEGAIVTLAWFGRLQGGAVSAYAADDSAPFAPGLVDEVARVMRWSPWTAGQEAAGQALTAMLAGVVVTLGLAPLLFVLALLTARARVGMARPAVLGAVLGIAAPVLGLVLLAAGNPAAELTLNAAAVLRALPWLLIGGFAGYLVARHKDNERQIVTFIAACGAALVATTTLAFVNYHGWAAFLGLI